MGLEIDPDIFKWLQAIRVIKQGKRANNGLIQLPQNTVSRFFDGLYVSHILKFILRQKGDNEGATKLDSIKQNSTPAIRLYNWNILVQGLKKIGYTIEYSQKSKLLNMERQPLIKIINYLYNQRKNDQIIQKPLTVLTNDISKKQLKDSINVFEFLVISICKHFKLSPQHALNLFLDQNKFLSHLLVKGVKGSFQPIFALLSDCIQYISFIVESLLCVDQKQSLMLFLNAIKPCLISKQKDVASRCIDLLNIIYESYLTKSSSLPILIQWMNKQGYDTILFAIKRHKQLLSKCIHVLYIYLDQKLFQKIIPSDKSILWSSQQQKIIFYSQFFKFCNRQLLDKFVCHKSFQQWNKFCVRAFKRISTTQQQVQLIFLFQDIWRKYPDKFEQSTSSLPQNYTYFLKKAALDSSQIISTQAIRTLFTLTYQLGINKNHNAPTLLKTILSVFKQINIERSQQICQGIINLKQQIATLPISIFLQPLIVHLQNSTTTYLLQLTQCILKQSKVKQQQSEDICELLSKIIFNDVMYAKMAIQIIVRYLQKNGRIQALMYHCRAGLAQFYSNAKQTHRSLKQLQADYQKYNKQQSMKKGDPTYIRNISKYIILNNIVEFIQKSIFQSQICKQEAQSIIFHTYIRIEKQLGKQQISKLLLPLMKSYYDDEQLPIKVEQYLQQLNPSVMILEQLNQSERSSPFLSPIKSKSSKVQSFKTQKSDKFKQNGMQYVKKQLQSIKKKRQQQQSKFQLKLLQQQKKQQKQQLYRSMVNEKRIIQFGVKKQKDIQYKYIYQFDSAPNNEKPLGIYQFDTIDLKNQQDNFAQDAYSIIKKYRKLWRFIFLNYSSNKGRSQTTDQQQKINSAQIWKFLKDYDIDVMKREEAMALIKKINQIFKNKIQLTCLNYQGFQQYILQFCYLGISKVHPTLPPGRLIAQLIAQMRLVTGSKGGNTQIFDYPQQAYFQQTQVIRQFNKRLIVNPDYPLPQGYKKIKLSSINFKYNIKQTKGISSSYIDVSQILNQLFRQKLGLAIFQPQSLKQQKIIARPVLFQNIKQKLKQYTGGYLLPKKSSILPQLPKDASPIKPQYHAKVEFSLGIKLGLASIDYKYKFIAQQVAYWLDDALDAVQSGKLKVNNKSKLKIKNQIIKRRQSQALQRKQAIKQQQKKQRQRAITIKQQAKKYVQNKMEQQARKAQQLKHQRMMQKLKEDQQNKKKLMEYQEAKSKLQSKRKAIQMQKQAELLQKKKEKVQYRKNVESYFKKKKQQIQELQRTIKANRQFQAKQLLLQKQKQIQKKRKLQTIILKRSAQILKKE